MPVWSGSGEGLLSFRLLIYYSLAWQKESELGSLASYNGTNLINDSHSLDIITSQRLHLQISSHWGLDFNRWIWRRHTQFTMQCSHILSNGLIALAGHRIKNHRDPYIVLLWSYNYTN